MNRSIRCKHGFCREVVPCKQCGDYDPCAAHEARNNRSKAQRRKSVITRPHGAPMSGRERLASKEEAFND